MCQMWIILRWFLFGLFGGFPAITAITMEQFDASLDMMRNGCAPKFKIPVEKLDAYRNGQLEGFDTNADIKCYAKCIAQLAGTVTKKGEFSVPKAIAQIPIILPPELQDRARNAMGACKEVQKDYKDSCDKVFFTTKCVRDFDPSAFKFP